MDSKADIDNKAASVLSPLKPQDFDASRLSYSSKPKQTPDGNYAVNVSYAIDQVSKAPVLLQTPRMTLRKNAFSADGKLVPVMDLVLNAKKTAAHKSFANVLDSVDARNVEEAHVKSAKWFSGKTIPKELIADYCKASLSPIGESADAFAFRATVQAPVFKRSGGPVKVFSSQGKELSPTVLAAGMDVSLILELPCLFCRKVTLGSLWKVVQIKVHPKSAKAVHEDAAAAHRYAFSDMPGDDDDSDDDLRIEQVSVSATQSRRERPATPPPAPSSPPPPPPPPPPSPPPAAAPATAIADASETAETGGNKRTSNGRRTDNNKKKNGRGVERTNELVVLEEVLEEDDSDSDTDIEADARDDIAETKEIRIRAATEPSSGSGGNDEKDAPLPDLF